MDYKKIYDDLMLKARSENRVKNIGVYYEAHHIIPRCLGGEGTTSQWSTHPNIILLTAKEHFVAHKLLCEIYPNNDKLMYAYFMMCNAKNSENNERKYRVTSREYEILRTKMTYLKRPDYIKIEQSKRMLGRTPWNKGKKNPGVGGSKKGRTAWNKGKTDIYSEEQIINMKLNQPNLSYFMDKYNGIFYTLDELVILLNHSKNYIRAMMSGSRRNKTNFIKV
jgi:hypothetical protein